MAEVKERGGVGRARRGGSRFISRAVKTENPVPRSFFAPKLNGNACYAGYCEALHKNTEFRKLRLLFNGLFLSILRFQKDNCHKMIFLNV